MLEVTVGEVIDSFIPWREISRTYFHAKAAEKAAAEEPAPAPVVPPVTFQEKPKIVEFETDNEESEEESDGSEDDDRPKISLGEEVKLDDFEDDKASISTEDELLQKAGEAETVALNL
jgi:hypothetical protein